MSDQKTVVIVPRNKIVNPIPLKDWFGVSGSASIFTYSISGGYNPDGFFLTPKSSLTKFSTSTIDNIRNTGLPKEDWKKTPYGIEYDPQSGTITGKIPNNFYASTGNGTTSSGEPYSKASIGWSVKVKDVITLKASIDWGIVGTPIKIPGNEGSFTLQEDGTILHTTALRSSGEFGRDVLIRKLVPAGQTVDNLNSYVVADVYSTQGSSETIDEISVSSCASESNQASAIFSRETQFDAVTSFTVSPPRSFRKIRSATMAEVLPLLLAPTNSV